jgi:hypothetical protein
MAYVTVKGKLGIARFLVNFFNYVGRVALWLVRLVPGRYFEKAELAVIYSFLPFQPARVSRFRSATTIVPPLDDTTYILIGTLLKQGFENKLIASEASCSVRTVQRIRLKRQQPEMPTPRSRRRLGVFIIVRYKLMAPRNKHRIAFWLIHQKFF